MDGNGRTDERLWVMVYGSAGVGEMGDDELRGVLEASRRNNARLGVTGMLLYRGGNFLQVLEGEQDAVRALYERIRKDPRHSGCIQFLWQPSERRMFPAWTMALRTDADLNAEHRRALDAFMRDASELPAQRSRAVLKLVDVFHRIMS